MEKSIFCGLDIIKFKILSNEILDNGFCKIYDLDNTIVRLNKTTGKYSFIKEKDVAIQQILKGNGVIYKNEIFFKNDETNKKYIAFQREYKLIEKKYKNFMSGEVYYNIKDLYNFALVKGLIQMYNVGVLSEEKFINKMKLYLNSFNKENFFKQLKMEFN